MTVRLPSRYEDLNEAYRGRLRANPSFLTLVKRAFSSMEISGGIRFLPLYGRSGSGKSCAALELQTHLPELRVLPLPREAVEDSSKLRSIIDDATLDSPRGVVAVVDQYEEQVAQRSQIPTSFVETLAILDRGPLRNRRVLFIWLTTSVDFREELARATTRNQRILLSSEFEIVGPAREDWPAIIEETFQVHNEGKDLADFELLESDLVALAAPPHRTLGTALENIGERLATYVSPLQDISKYCVVMLWPVTDGLRITTIRQFTDPRQGYKVDWAAWYRQLNADDRRQLPLHEYNRARLYFDLRLVPIAAADLHKLCNDLDAVSPQLPPSYLDRFKATHFFSIVSGTWNPEVYAPLRERDSERARAAREWYHTVTQEPTKLGRRLAAALQQLGVEAKHEQTITSPHSRVRADVLVQRNSDEKPNVIVELKAFSADNTMPSTICNQIQTTLKRHAQFAGFLGRQ